jgi:hypothetical protein
MQDELGVALPGEGLQRWNVVPTGALVDHQRPLVTLEREAERVAVDLLRNLHHLHLVRADRPDPVIAADRSRAIGRLELLLDRLRQRRKRTFRGVFGDEDSAVGERREVESLPTQIGRRGAGDGVPAALSVEPVDSDLAEGLEERDAGDRLEPIVLTLGLVGRRLRSGVDVDARLSSQALVRRLRVVSAPEGQCYP